MTKEEKCRDWRDAQRQVHGEMEAENSASVGLGGGGLGRKRKDEVKGKETVYCLRE